VVTLGPGLAFAQGLADLMPVIAASAAELVSISSAADQTEDAFFELLREEQGRGFTRSY
jgi:hypothetical protein